MQIDELPAGEQTQNPDLDMNQVVGTHDILMLCFDTLRYDVSKEEEEAGRTPVLNSHGGEWEKDMRRNFTYPSHFAIFAGFLPSPAEPHSLRSRKWLFFLCKLVRDVFRLREVIRLRKQLLCKALPM